MPKKIEVSSEMWERLRLEYISSDISLRGLESKYGIPFSQLQRKAKEGGWTDLRGERKSKAIHKSVDLIAEHQAEECSRAFRLASAVMNKLEEVVEQIDSSDDYATRNLKNITSAIKDLKEIGVFRSALDQMEQEARIKKLQKDAEDEQKDNTITVRFENMDEFGEQGGDAEWN